MVFNYIYDEIGTTKTRTYEEGELEQYESKSEEENSRNLLVQEIRKRKK